MAKISITYPESWLTVNISVKDRLTWVEAFSGVMTEVAWVYNYDFVETALTDYTYTATTPWYADVPWVLFQDTSSWGWGGASWNDLIEDNSSVVWSFWQKFAQYGWVSHVIDRSSFDEESKKEIKSITDKLADFKLAIDAAPKVETKYIESTREIVRIEKVPVPTTESKALARIITRWLKELGTTLSSIIVKWLIEIKNNK